MAVLDEIVLALASTRVAGHSPVLAKSLEFVLAAGDQFVDICLMADIPENAIGRAIEDPVQSKRQLDHPEVGGEMATGSRNGVDHERPDLGGQLRQLVVIELTQIGRASHPSKQGIGCAHRSTSDPKTLPNRTAASVIYQNSDWRE